MKNRVRIILYSILIMVVFVICLRNNALVCIKDTIKEVSADLTRVKAEDEQPEATPKPVTIKVSGLQNHYNKTPKATIRDTVTVKPAVDCKVSLMMCQSGNGKWKEMAGYDLKEADQGKVELVYPEAWKNKNSSLWRLEVTGPEGSEPYISEEILITVRNRKKVKLNAKSALIMDADSGEIFYGKAMDQKRANASTTKIMTALLAIENKSLKSKVKITKKAAYTPYSHLGAASVNDKILMKDLLYMAMLPSDNGAAMALGLHTAGGEKAFLKKMNQKAKELGCTHTNFKTPHGLDEKGHYTTAEDLGMIAAYALQNDVLREVAGTDSYHFKTKKKHLRYKVSTTNALLGKVNGVYGLKTGFTNHAGYCFVGAYHYKQRNYVTVVLGSSTSDARWKDTKALIRYIRKNL